MFWVLYSLHNFHNCQDQDNVFGDADLEPYCKFCFAKRFSFNEPHDADGKDEDENIFG